SAGPPAGTAASFGRDIADRLQPTVWQSKEPPARVPTDFMRFRREKRSPGTGVSEASISRLRHNLECETEQPATPSVGVFLPEAFGPPHALTTLIRVLSGTEYENPTRSPTEGRDARQTT